LIFSRNRTRKSVEQLDSFFSRYRIAIGNGVARSRQQIGQGDWFPQRAWQ
jgi:hypothetical protein